MRLKNVELTNFRVMESAKVDMQGKSAVIFGINGTGNPAFFERLIALCKYYQSNCKSKRIKAKLCTSVG